jgi:hypothetical protein
MAVVPRPVSRLLEAANAHDTNAFLAAFTDDSVVDDWEREFAGPEAIRGWSDSEFIGVAVSLSVTEANVTEDEATILAEGGGKGYAGPSHFTFTLRDGLVSRMTIAERTLSASFRTARLRIAGAVSATNALRPLAPTGHTRVHQRALM